MIEEDAAHKEGFCEEVRPGPCGVVIFGASGDLSRRKLIPSLFSLALKNLLPERFYVTGCARTNMSDSAFREKVADILRAAFPQASEEKISGFVSACFYVSGGYEDSGTYSSLSKRLDELDKKFFIGRTRVFYLATPPDLFMDIVGRLGASGLIIDPEDCTCWSRVVVEKPFGRDAVSAGKLDEKLKSVLSENQIYRIDHYLGKETVQNILMLRFANAVFEPVWNSALVDNVQITVAETIGVGHRAGYFDRAGIMRDMFQNHMLQLLSLVAMEPPLSFSSDSIRDEKVRLLKSVRPLAREEICECVRRGQYGPGTAGGKSVPGYRQEENVRPDSVTETYACARITVGNERWKGVPFYLRTGKRLARHTSSIAVTFKKQSRSIFAPIQKESILPNVFCMNIQPEEGISLTIEVKHPGPKVCLTSKTMLMNYREHAEEFAAPDAYERLLLDIMLGDQTLFVRSDDMLLAWELMTPVLEAWENEPKKTPLEFYPAGSWGPESAGELLKRDGRKWIL